MVLLIDIGNSFIKWAWLADDADLAEDNGLPELHDAGEVLHIDEDIPALLDDTWAGLAVPAQVWLANVAGADMEAEVCEWIRQHWGCKTVVAHSQASSAGLVNAYLEPARLGVDRWLAMLAAYRGRSRPTCVIDCGSAITVDAVDESGQHLGGLILPGLQMMQDVLFDSAEGIDDGEPGEAHPGMLFATDTVSAVEAGSLYAVVATIERVVSDMEKELGTGIACILTGGDAQDILPLLSITVSHQPQLVLQGLALYAAEMTGDVMA